MTSYFYSLRHVLLAMLVLAFGMLYFLGSSQPIHRYIPDQPLWVYQSDQIQTPPFHPTLQEPFRLSKRWLSGSHNTYWYAVGLKAGAQTESYLLFLSLSDSEREFLEKVKGKVRRRPYQKWEILSLISEQLHAVKIDHGWLMSPSDFLLEKALDGSESPFSNMPLHIENTLTALFVPKISTLSFINSSPWNQDVVYFYRPNSRKADMKAPDFLVNDWIGQNPYPITSWKYVPDQLERLDLWHISSREAWAASHPDWPESWHFLLPPKGGACWQFQTKGERPILWLPIEDEDAIPFLSGGQSGEGGIYPLAINFLGQKLLGESIANPAYFMPMDGGIAFSESTSALQWYLNQRLTGISASQSRLFSQEIIPELLPRQSRLTILFPHRGPTYLAWEGIHGLQNEASARFSYGKPLPTVRSTSWVKQTWQDPPKSSSSWLRQEASGQWILGNRALSIQTEINPTNLASWSPQDGLWIGSLGQQTVWHAKSKRTFDVTGDSPMVGLFSTDQGQTCILTKFGQIIPLHSEEGLQLSKSTQLERMDRHSEFQVVISSQGDPVLLRKDETNLTTFTPDGRKTGTIQTKVSNWKHIRYEVLPNKMAIVILFDGQSHYLYTQDGIWLGQKEIPGSGPLEIQYAASYRKLMVYSQLNGQWQLWALGPIDN